MLLSWILGLACCATPSHAFVLPQSPSLRCNTPDCANKNTNTRMNMMMPSEAVVENLDGLGAALASSHALLALATDAETARGEFYFVAAAGSGAGGIGAAQIPKFFEYITDNRSLDGVGPTQGGEELNTGIASLVYPTLYQQDIQQILQKLPTADTIVAKGTSKGFLASKGYVVRQDFVAALPGCNPLAAGAAFDALTRGSGAALSPVDYEERLAGYRETPKMLVSDLQTAVLTKLSAFGALMFLLSGLAYVIISDARVAFF